MNIPWEDLQAFLVKTTLHCIFDSEEVGRLPDTEQLYYQTDKSSHRMCSIKKAVLKNFAIFIYLPVAKFLRTPILKNICVQLLLISQTFKSSSYKKFFPKCVCYWYNLRRRMFFIPCDNWKPFFKIIFTITQSYCATAMLLRSLKQVF